jgi:hypothetical protein
VCIPPEDDPEIGSNMCVAGIKTLLILDNCVDTLRIAWFGIIGTLHALVGRWQNSSSGLASEVSPCNSLLYFDVFRYGGGPAFIQLDHNIITLKGACIDTDTLS